MVAATTVPDAVTSVKLDEEIELARTASLKLTVIGVAVSTPVALSGGLVFITVGVVTDAAVVVNVYEKDDIETPELFSAPLTVTV